MPQQGAGVTHSGGRCAPSDAARHARHLGDGKRDAMSLNDEVRALHESAAAIDRSDRGAVLVTGPDRWSYLQNLVSADLDAVGDGEGVHSLLLTPQGKLDVDFRLLQVGDEAWLDCDPGFGEQLAASLNRFRGRSCSVSSCRPRRTAICAGRTRSWCASRGRAARAWTSSALPPRWRR